MAGPPWVASFGSDCFDRTAPGWRPLSNFIRIKLLGIVMVAFEAIGGVK